VQWWQPVTRRGSLLLYRARALCAPRLPVTVAVCFILSILLFSDRAEGSLPGANGRLAFTWVHDSGVDSTQQGDLATVDRTGADFRFIDRADYDVYFTSGDWSPLGRRIVYAADWCDGCGPVGIVSARANGSDRRVLRSSMVNGFSTPVWSPDGQRIAFIRWRWTSSGNRRSDIYVMRRDGSDVRRVTYTRRNEFYLDWSSRNRLVFVRRGDLFTMRPNGRRVRRLTETAAVESQPDWAPGGTRLTFVRNRDVESEVWKMRRSGENAAMLASGHSPTWSPDGSLIAYVAIADGAIHTVKPSGADDTLIGKPVTEGRIEGLDWQPVPAG
jgi:Tol biopolymer transport system component